MKPHNPWDTLDAGDARRVDIEGRYDFFWVVLEAGMRGLMLRLPSLPEPAPRLPKLKNLVASFRSIPRSLSEKYPPGRFMRLMK